MRFCIHLFSESVIHMARNLDSAFLGMPDSHGSESAANAQHVKNVPGRKTDTKDSEWLAELLQYGLLRSSFVRVRDMKVKI